MEWKMNPNAVNQFTKGSDIYTEGEPVFSIAMIIKGRVMIHNNGAKVLVGSGSFLGLNDLFTGKFQSTYTAYDDLIIYAFAVSRTEELERILSSNKDYHGFMVVSFQKVINELDQIYQSIMKHGSDLYDFLITNYTEYSDLAARAGYKAKSSDRHKSLVKFDSDMEILRDRIDFNIECRNIPMDVMKAFYSYGNSITLYQVEDQVEIVNQQIETLKDLSDRLFVMAECLVDDSDTCLYKLIAGLGVEMVNAGSSSSAVMDAMDNIIEEMNKIEKFTERMLGREFSVDRKRMEEVYHLLLTGSKDSDVSVETSLKYSKDESEKALTELQNSYQSLLEYAEIEATKSEEMQRTMLDFLSLRDKASADDSARSLRRKLTDYHYELYKPLFLKYYKNENTPRIVDMFLKYGFADERLLTKEQLLALYFIKEGEGCKLCNVYNIKEWLTLIYEGKKEPSKNEFDLDYPEMLTNLRKQAQITDNEAKAWLTDSEKKLEYEIQNMFRYNNRTTNGQISSFVPILHKDQIMGHMDRLLITPEKVEEAVASIMRIDYSVFDREVLYVNNEKNITKEYIIKRVNPDIILMPTVGMNGIMWQEITGRKRDSAGRFLLPIFSDANVAALLVKVFGRFRWELCRSIEGPAWNDISHKSLTSEYSDYIQFYRKNKDLSEEKKEKIKHQIQKGRGSSREIFAIDYEQWVNYEAVGAFKLNKPVREMMATYCPFSRELREQLKHQPVFEEAMARYYREKQKKVREIEARYRLLAKDQIELTQELVDTLQYHKEQ